jgi:hypothetical protein
MVYNPQSGYLRQEKPFLAHGKACNKTLQRHYWLKNGK